MSKILIVGGGLTGAVTAYLLKKECKNMEVVIWEKAEHLGGRICTCPCNERKDCVADLGLQFVVIGLDSLKSHARFYDEIINSKILTKCPSKIEGMNKRRGVVFIAPNGFSSVVEYLCKEGGAKVRLNHEVKSISLNDKRWVVTSTKEESMTFDAVIITIPVPCALKLEGNFKDAINSENFIKEMFEAVTYVPQHTLALYYFKPVEVIKNIPWAAKICKEDGIVRFISIDNKKRGTPNALPAIVLQATTKFSEKCVSDEAFLKDQLQKKLADFLPNFPNADRTTLQCWKYGKIASPFPGYIGCFVLNIDPIIILAGDGFTQSSFQGCLDSAFKTVEYILKLIK